MDFFYIVGSSWLVSVLFSVWSSRYNHLYIWQARDRMGISPLKRNAFLKSIVLI
jgi:hypothetical protein